MRRVETDGDAVHITTVHSAKGLEYPDRPRSLRLHRATGGQPALRVQRRRRSGGRRRLVGGVGRRGRRGSKAALAAAGERKRLAKRRSRRRCAYACSTSPSPAPSTTSRSGGRRPVAPARSALGRLLLDRWGAGPVFNSPLGDAYEKRRRGHDEQADRCPRGRVERHDRPLRRSARAAGAHTTAAARRCRRACSPSPTPARRHPLADPARRTWSFTAITAGLAVSPAERATVAPVAGGYDELPASRRRRPSRRRGPLRRRRRGRRSAAGRRPGRHDVRHRCPRGPRDRSTSRRRRWPATSPSASPRCRGVPGSSSTCAATTAGLVAVVDTPLGEQFDGRPLARLRDAPTVSPSWRSTSRSSPTRVAAADIGKVLADDPRPRRPAARVRPPPGIGAGGHRARRVAHRLDRRRVPRRRRTTTVRRRRLQVQPPASAATPSIRWRRTAPTCSARR